MKHLLLISAALLLSVAASLGVTHFCPARQAASGTSSSVAPEDIARLERALAESEARQAAMAKSVEDLGADLALRSSQDSRVPLAEIEAAVARAVGRPAVETAKEDPGVSPSAVTTKAFDARTALQELTTPGLTREEKMAKWKAIDAAGGLDEVVAMFEEYAREHPDSAGAQVELGGAYLQKVFKAGNGPEAGVWATKADKAFDAGLAIDDHNWDARFSKAVSLSFWPPVFGKGTEAIKHFEILCGQQADQSSEPKFAQTWVLLGNLYQQLGKSEQALATWEKGLALFPGNGQLEQQIANAQGR